MTCQILNLNTGGEPANVQRVPLITLFDDYQYNRNLSPNTRRRRRWTLEAFREQLELGGCGGFAEATAADVEHFLATKRAPATRKAFLTDLMCFYRWAVRRGYLEANPAELVELPRVPRRTARPLSSFELELALRAAGPRLRVMVMLGSHAGLRVSEIAELARSDVDACRSVIVVRGGKGDKDRIVPLHADLAAAIGQIALRRDGRVIGTSGQNVSNRIRDHFRLLAIPHRPHDLRATFATELARLSNGNTSVVADLLGHVSTETTKRYVAWAPAGRPFVDALYAAA